MELSTNDAVVVFLPLYSDVSPVSAAQTLQRNRLMSYLVPPVERG